MTRQSPWDDFSRERALRLAEHERLLCTCGCGLPMSIAHDPNSLFFADDFVCYAGKFVAQVERKTRAAAEVAKKPDGWDDGMHWWVAEYDPKRHKPKTPKPRGG